MWAIRLPKKSRTKTKLKCVRDVISFYLLSKVQLKTSVLEFDASENILRRKSASVSSLIVEGMITYVPGFTVILK